ncbi:hypothetical protein XSP_004058 [Xanthomonas euroxanthea]|uniref:Uncharacterized protein n=1 Tax=Xanthomonas euroxanthea TaxID=2259622 RepID=A0A8E4E9C0_9XANT|nr:hypothetical protein [Xanthomonas euroxanthea]CAD1797621.1 hypothetical protein XSP_004058 [Xanthomonas euroxanthea]SYZ57858.1 hypothetical protein CPBF367_41410 [Xanthomonas arboricola pv. juglandis]
MTTSKALTTNTRQRVRPAAKLQPNAEPFTFGVTLQQIDQFHTLLRTITAQSDMVAVCSGKSLDATSLSVLGENIFNAARAVRAIVDEIDTQRLHDGGVDTTG